MSYPIVLFATLGLLWGMRLSERRITHLAAVVLWLIVVSLCT